MKAFQPHAHHRSRRHKGVASRLRFGFASNEKVSDSNPHRSTSSLYSTSNNKLELNERTWMFQNKFPIAYELATCTDDTRVSSQDVVPILLLNGFGVGSFHQHRLMRQLLLQHESSRGEEEHTKYNIYGIDYLGQGKSWPLNCNDGMSEDEYNLGYSADMWIDQLHDFIEQVIIPSTSQKVHVVGNSVGGYLGTILAYRHPHLVSTLTLMNATPVWGLNLPGWDGKLPAPPLPKVVGRTLFDTIRNLDVIDKYLDVAYVYKQAFDGTFADSFENESSEKELVVPLKQKIRGCTEGQGGHAAFASILWSPPASSSDIDGNILRSLPAIGYYDALKQLQCDVLLLFGSNDEWCTPAVAKRMHTTLTGRVLTSDDYFPCQRYVTIDNAGHCPNHEAPTAVARVLESWLGASDRSAVRLVSGQNDIVQEPWGNVVLREVSIDESKNVGLVDKMISSMVG